MCESDTCMNVGREGAHYEDMCGDQRPKPSSVNL